MDDALQILQQINDLNKERATINTIDFSLRMMETWTVDRIWILSHLELLMLCIDNQQIIYPDSYQKICQEIKWGIESTLDSFITKGNFMPIWIVLINKIRSLLKDESDLVYWDEITNILNQENN